MSEDSGRSEQEIFDELATLCASPGYAHAIAYICFRDNIVRFSKEIKPEDMHEMFSSERLIRTEISTLIGLMVKVELDLAAPKPKRIQEYIDRTDKLLTELHQSMNNGWLTGLTPESLAEGFNPFMQGENYREPIFYGGESAYVFQYRDMAIKKYAADNPWLQANKGFTIDQARSVVRALEDLQEKKLSSTLEGLKSVPPDKWTLLPGFTFSRQELAYDSGISGDIVGKVLSAFSLPLMERNSGFNHLNDFNIANAFPVLALGEDKFLLFQGYSLAEALYEAPFYWMGADKGYTATAMRNRGASTEAFARERLERVFGNKCVYANIDIFASKGRKAGEIDVLVLYGGRAIVVQAKSKRLTLEARKGNDGQLKEDFKKSIQDSYDQGHTCAQLLIDSTCVFRDAKSNEIAIPADIKEIYIICLVSDHYPALSFQALHFLKTRTTDRILPPFVMDVFTLDAMTEMLETPLRLLSYLDRRVKYSERVVASQELAILAYHLSKNLWLDDSVTMTMLADDFSVPLDIAMAARRQGIPGKRTPEGVLTRLTNTAIGKIIKDIEARPEAGVVDLGFLLLSLGEETVLDVSRMIETVTARALKDGQTHDVTVAVSTSGLTIHFNSIPFPIAEPSLREHCTNRKYVQHSRTWFGLCLSPTDRSIRFGLKLDYEWKQDDAMDRQTKNMAKPTKLTDYGKLPRRSNKVGRNQPCPCGSGIKYKRCHGAK